MKTTRTEFAALAERQGLARDRRIAPQAEQVLRAELAVNAVTGDPNWDRLLEMIQATLNDARQAKVAHEAAAMDPRVVDPAVMMQHKVQALLMAERVKVLEAVIAIPAELKRNGDAARDLLARLKESEDGTADAA